MLIRLLLTLMLALSPVAASAASNCHAPAPAPHHAMPPAPEHKATPAHVCIGCIPPGDWLRAPLAAPAPIVAMPDAGAIAALTLGRAGPPALPPPRLG